MGHRRTGGRQECLVFGRPPALAVWRKPPIPPAWLPHRHSASRGPRLPLVSRGRRARVLYAASPRTHKRVGRVIVALAQSAWVIIAHSRTHRVVGVTTLVRAHRLASRAVLPRVRRRVAPPARPPAALLSPLPVTGVSRLRPLLFGAVRGGHCPLDTGSFAQVPVRPGNRSEQALSQSGGAAKRGGTRDGKGKERAKELARRGSYDGEQFGEDGR